MQLHKVIQYFVYNTLQHFIHNYKKKFKEEGLKFPSIRGKRPTGAIDLLSREPVVINNNPTTKNGYKFVVNGVSVEISAQAKNVTIGKDSMEINF